MFMRLAVTLVMALSLSSVAHAVPVPPVPTPAATCTAAKLPAPGRQAHKLLTCQAKAAKLGVSVAPACVSQAENLFLAAFSSAEDTAVQQGGQWATVGDAATVEGRVGAFVSDVVAAL